jgi:hypothetical protein
MTETQQRFLRAIAERVPMERVVELHLFPAIRQGGVETGMAVVAEQPHSPQFEASPPVVDAPVVEALDAEARVDAPADAPASIAEASVLAEPAAEDLEPSAARRSALAMSRLTIHTARYRLTLKGIDRGKWEVDVVAEADAPLESLDAVIRGVQRRAGEGAEPDRLSTDAFREAIDAPLATLER